MLYLWLLLLVKVGYHQAICLGDRVFCFAQRDGTVYLYWYNQIGFREISYLSSSKSRIRGLAMRPRASRIFFLVEDPQRHWLEVRVWRASEKGVQEIIPVSMEINPKVVRGLSISPDRQLFIVLSGGRSELLSDI